MLPEESTERGDDAGSREAGPPPPGEEGVETAEEACFRAVTPLGEVTLILHPGKGSRPEAADPLLQAACRLGRVEPLLCELEAWLDTPLDFVPVPRPDAGGIRVELAGESSGEGDVPAELHLPREALPRLAPPPDGLLGRMRWGTALCWLELELFAIPRCQLAKVKPGAMVLIPASFESFWSCRMRLEPDDGESPFRAELDAGRQRLIFELFEPGPTARSGAETPAPQVEREPVSFLLPLPLAVPVDRLLGWAEQPVFALGRLLSHTDIVLHRAGRELARGELASLGSGYGVWIRELAPGDGENEE